MIKLEREERPVEKPFIGRSRVLLERIDSLDQKWCVEFWDNRYFFLGIEIFATKSEVVKKKC